MSAPSFPRVLFVSKPIAPPFHDGSKCIVRDLATHLASVRPIVMTTKDAPLLSEKIVNEPVYPTRGAFAPAVRDNARVMQRLLLGSRPELWHFVFAPNPLSSTAARIAQGLRRVPTIQTVASVPRSFENVSRLLFGDRIVALSVHTRDRLVANGADPARIVVIPPAVPAIAPLPKDVVLRARAEIGIPDDRPLVIYPGDLETSQGAKLVAEAAPGLLARSSATLVFACRQKTPRAAMIQEELASRLRAHGDRVRFVGEVSSLLSLLATASLVLFPVDDLYGKVDMPIAVLEAMELGVPVLALDDGPLAELAGIVRVDARSSEIVEKATLLLEDPSRAREVSEEAREGLEARHRPATVALAYEAIYDDLLAGRVPRPVPA